jgi:sulfonate transport system permease protein
MSVALSRRAWAASGAKRFRRLIGPALLAGIWVAGSGSGAIPSRILPGPSAVVATGRRLLSDGQLVAALGASLERVAIGLTIGVVAGTLLAVVSGLTRLGDDLVDAPMQMLRTLPILALVPLFIVWFGIGEVPKISLIALGATFPIYLNLTAAIRGTDQRLVDAARSVGLSRFGVIRHVVLPGAAASWLVGLRYSAGVAWLILVVSEQINATNGIGALMTNAETFLDTNTIVVCLVVYALLGLVTDAAVRFSERKVLAWR